MSSNGSKNIPPSRRLPIRLILNIIASLFIVLSTNELKNLATGATTCFENRFPKLIQGISSAKENRADAITKHEGLESLYVGGHIFTYELNPRS